MAAVLDEPWTTRRASADDAKFISLAVTRDRGSQRKRHAARNDHADNAPVVRSFPVADLIAGPPNGGPTFRDASELMRLLKKMTGLRHWRESGRMTFFERRQLLRVQNDGAAVAEVERLLGRLRNPGSTHAEVTVRLLVLPKDCDENPSGGAARIVSASKARRLLKTWRSFDAERNHEAEYVLADRDIVYVWTSRDTSRDAAARGLSAVVQPQQDGSGARITPYPFAGDESKVNWPELIVGVGQSAIYDLPLADAAPDDADRVLAIVTVTSVSPSDRP
jgi:hypothetical protein